MGNPYYYWVGATLGLCSLVSGCQWLSAPPKPASGLKIGTLLPITGDLSQYGSSMQDSARLLVDTVNACGGVLGQPITLVSEDDQTDPAVGAQAMSKLVEVDQVTGVVGAAASSVSAAGVDIAVRNQVMQISPASTSPVFTERARAGEFQGYWARTAAPDTFQGQALAQLAQKQGFKSVAVLAINNDYGNGLIDVFVPAFTALGGTVVNAAQPTRYDPAGTTFEAELRQVFAGRPDAVLLIAYPETGSLILKSAYQLGLLGQTTQLLVTDGLQEVGIAAQVGQTRAGQYIATGMMGTAPSAGGPALQAFQSQYQDRYQRQPKVFDPHTWDAAALLVLAAEAAQGTTGTAMRDRLPDIANPPGTEVSDVCAALALLRANQPINYQGASGSVDLNAQGDVTGWYDVWTIAEDGQLQIQDRILVQPHP